MLSGLTSQTKALDDHIRTECAHCANAELICLQTKPARKSATQMKALDEFNKMVMFMTLLNNFTFPAFLSSSNLFISTEEHGNETFKTKKEQSKRANLLYLP